MSRSARSAKAGGDNGAKSVPPQKIFETMKEMTGATDDDIQTMLQLCGGDVNEATTKLLENPFSKVTSKKEKRKQKEEDRKKEPPVPRPPEYRRPAAQAGGRGKGRPDGRYGGGGRGGRRGGDGGDAYSSPATDGFAPAPPDDTDAKVDADSSRGAVGGGGGNDSWGAEEKPSGGGGAGGGGGDVWSEADRVVDAKESTFSGWGTSTGGGGGGGGDTWGATNGWSAGGSGQASEAVPANTRPPAPTAPASRTTAPGTSFASVIRGSAPSANYNNTQSAPEATRTNASSSFPAAPGTDLTSEGAAEVGEHALRNNGDLSGVPISPPAQNYQSTSLSLGASSAWTPQDEAHGHALRSGLDDIAQTAGQGDSLLGVKAPEVPGNQPNAAATQYGSYGSSQSVSKTGSYNQSSALDSLQLTFGNFNLKPQGVSEFNSSFGSAFDERSQGDASVFGGSKPPVSSSIGYNGKGISDGLQGGMLAATATPGVASAVTNDAFKAPGYAYSPMISAGEKVPAVQPPTGEPQPQPQPQQPQQQQQGRSALNLGLSSGGPTSQGPLRSTGTFSNYTGAAVSKPPGAGTFQYGLGGYDASSGAPGYAGAGAEALGAGYTRAEDLNRNRGGVVIMPPAPASSVPATTVATGGYAASGQYAGAGVKGYGADAAAQALSFSGMPPSADASSESHNPAPSMSSANPSAPLPGGHALHMPYGNPAMLPGPQYGSGLYQYPGYYAPGTHMYPNMQFYNPYSQMGGAYGQSNTTYPPTAGSTYGLAPRGATMYSHPHSGGAAGSGKHGTGNMAGYGATSYGISQTPGNRYGAVASGYDDLHGSGTYGMAKDKEGAGAYTGGSLHQNTGGHAGQQSHVAGGYQPVYNQRDYYGSQGGGQGYGQHPGGYSHQQPYGQYQQYGQYGETTGQQTSGGQNYK